MKMCFLLRNERVNVKCYFCSSDIYIFVLTFGYVETRLAKKAKVNFKIYGVTARATNNDYTKYSQYIACCKI